MEYNNPIIPGFHPDPSICRVGSDYYLVASTFGYFPGVPVFHSCDLIHWHQIGHCLTRLSQLSLDSDSNSKGIFAPTIRYHAGVFYMVTTNVSVGKHFYVFSENPASDWSDPIWIEAEGIDPSLLFDDDGRVFFTWTNLGDIVQCEIDIQTGQCLTPPRRIWSGTGGRYPEGPHLYKVNDRYYLMIAEGGTEYGHMVTIARSQSPWGPFESCPRNPILTHRHRGSHPIQGVGHADMVQAHDGSWWTVFLGFRRLEEFSNYHHLGRETFLAPLIWDEQGWPVINRDGTVELKMQAPTLPTQPWPPEPIRDHFHGASLNLCWNFLGNLPPETWSLLERPDWLRLKGSPLTLDNPGSPVFVGRRQQHFSCKAATLLDFAPTQDGQEAGLTVFMNREHHYEIAVLYEDDTCQVILRRRIGDLSAVVMRRNFSGGRICLQIQADPTQYSFSYIQDGHMPVVLGTGATRYLSSEVAGGFTGVYLGMYATSNGKPVEVVADFDWFDYQPTISLETWLTLRY
jgi:xylan 1,4-beta-xylosidase